MQVYLRIILLYLISSTVALTIHKRVNLSLRGCLAKACLFYIGIFHAALLLVKKISGKEYVTLLDAFVSDSLEKYLILLILFVAVSVAAPVVIRKILHEKVDAFISMSLSLTMSIYTIVYFTFDAVNDGKCFVIILGGSMLAFLLTCFYKGDVEYCDRKNLKSRLVWTVPIVSFWIVLMILYLPNELYLNNTSDMQIPYKPFIQALLLGSLIHFVVYISLLVVLVTEKQLKLTCKIVFSVTVVGYLQSAFLNGKMSIMDGTRQEWSVMSILINVVIWCSLIVVLLLLPYLIKKNIGKVYSMVCVYISLVLLATWGYMGITSPPAEEKEYYELTTDGRMELSAKQNVLVFVLDWFDGQIADEIFEQDPDFSEALRDFTWYRNTSSLYAFTSMSVPYLLTNIEWKYDMNGTEYKEYGYQETSFLYDIMKQNYDIGIYTYSQYLSKEMANVVSNYSDRVDQGWNLFNIMNKMVRCSRYKTHSFLLKNKFWYYADSNFFMDMRNKNSVALNPGDDSQFYKELQQEGIHIGVDNEYEGAYRFYHLVGAHPPFEPDMISKGKNCLSMVYEYLEQLKECGLYDNATIIITADHGHNLIGDEREEQLNLYGLEMPSSPILFVKKTGQENEKGPEISMAPVSHAEFAATVIDEVSDGKIDYGDTFFDISEDSDRERHFVFKRGEELYEYMIEGDVRDWNNWHLQEQ